MDFENTDFRENPHLYKVGRGEQGVLSVEPYKSEILPHWRFRTEEIARESAAKIYSMFLEYKEQNDFIGMDMARKFLQMGYTRARRYANHRSGKKYDENGNIHPQEPDALDNEKARAARASTKSTNSPVRTSTTSAAKRSGPIGRRLQDPARVSRRLLDRGAHRVVAAVHVDHLPGRRRPPVAQETHHRPAHRLGVGGIPA